MERGVKKVTGSVGETQGNIVPPKSWDPLRAECYESQRVRTGKIRSVTKVIGSAEAKQAAQCHKVRGSAGSGVSQKSSDPPSRSAATAVGPVEGKSLDPLGENK